MPGPVKPVSQDRLAVQPLPFDAVVLSPDGVLGAWQQVNAAATLPHCIEHLEKSAALANMRGAAGLEVHAFEGFHFADSDIYKVLEAIGWEAGRSDVGRFLPFVDRTIQLLGQAQQPDGYLNSFYSATPEKQFSDLRWGHELYCLGHLLQAGIAWARTTGRRDLLEIGIRFAERVEEEFPPGGRLPVCGHPEIETALAELYRLAGEERWLDLAVRMVDARGHRSVGPDRFGYGYFQDHEPVREVRGATGHVVRQLYLAAGVADVYTEAGDTALLEALHRIWSDVHLRKMYITGGLGSRHRDEAFGDPFELPPDRAYSETCAAISSVQFNWRMLLLTGEGRFADELERALYNAVAGSISPGGTEFFYSNPLQVRTERDGEHEQAPARRARWYDCACCPPNIARLIASISSYTATADDDGGLQLHLYDPARITLPAATVTVATGYPFDGRVVLKIDGTLTGVLALRIPAWSHAFTLRVDGEPQSLDPENGYVRIAAMGVAQVELKLDTSVQLRQPHPHLDAARGCVAVTRGPLVYTLEQTDLPDGVLLEDFVLDASRTLVDAGRDAVLGVPLIRVHGSTRARPAEPYPDAAVNFAISDRISANLVPYYRWGNRGPGGMRVWIPPASR
ncbi:hypothetical protein BJ994_000468 [Arthrobacter pigmenti]|uniref:Glycoside hydrolase family 127 protein n=1 Tax=Arthrobacter pigmenti TaxID=271432 RepID=A0A846RL63_9MICC|nr:beta-L-arabinofuranosidase domain-containing protein [Arthrobacter pigmenti]NJC21392.1 hypothetical protein [Arthrobacter pigmenti]